MVVWHTLQPVYDSDSKILILGTMPSPKSREVGFYYGHPQNRFWKVLGGVLKTEFPADREGKTRLLHQYHIALWDVLERCSINGAQDASIKDGKPNDLSLILKSAPIEVIFTTGTTAHRLYDRLLLPETGRPAIGLPSTSPANCQCTLEHLIEEYRILLRYL